MISPEFRLAVACARASFAKDGLQDIREIAARIDWHRFVRVVRFHRIQGLVWTSLLASEAGAPEEVAEALSSDARAIVAKNLGIAAEARELRFRFEQVGIDLLFIKGLTVGALAYPVPFLKMGWDIDVLVHDRDLEKAAVELIARGYHRVVPTRSVDLKSWHSREKESVWATPEKQIHIELHTRLADNRHLIPDIGMGSPRREVEVAPGISLPTLSDDHLFAYLCVHGASSLWFRLKWITDLAAILHRVAPGEVTRLYRRSQELGADRAAGQALLLANHLYGCLHDIALRRDLEKQFTIRCLATAALRQLGGHAEPREPRDKLLGTALIHLTQFGLAPGWKFKLSEMSHQVRHLFARPLAHRLAER